MKDKDIKRSARQGLKPASGKTSISLRVDAEVLEWFKARLSEWLSAMFRELLFLRLFRRGHEFTFKDEVSV